MVLQWGRDLSVAETWTGAGLCVSSESFNGAATFQSRKPRAGASWHRLSARQASMGPRPFSRGNWHRRKSLRRMSVELQWGRDLSVAETSHSPRGRSPEGPASMGPRPFSRGNERIRYQRTLAPSGFNGAATFQSRKLVFSRHLLTPFSASFNGAATFQSRKPTPPPAKASKAEAASMGPRPFSRGNFC